MNSDQNRANDLIELITWAVERILNGQYEVIRQKDGNLSELELGTSLGPGMAVTTEQIERVLEKVVPKLCSPETLPALLALKTERSDEQLEKVLAMLFDPPEASMALSELKDASWEEILIYIDSYFVYGSHLLRKIGTLIVKEREGFSSPSARDVEGSVELSSPGWISLFTVRKYAAEFKELLPNVVGRADVLRLLPASRTVPPDIRAYMVAASRAYVYGHFLASLVLCRSVIEHGVKDRLRTVLLDRDVEEIDDFSVAKLLRLARKHGLLDDARWEQADNIRELARTAVHPREGQSPPTVERCKDAFIQTRGVLEHLYE